MKKFVVLFLIIMIGVSSMKAAAFLIATEERIRSEKRLLATIELELNNLHSIIEQRNLIINYQESGQNALILSNFSALSRELEDSYRAGDDIQIRLKHQKMSYIFKEIGLVQDRYLFYDALYLYFNRDTEQAKERLILLVDNFPESVKIKPALSLLQTILIVNDHNREYLELIDRFPYLSTDKSRYLAAHTHFNLREYDKARAFFTELTNAREYRFRSEIMLGILHYVNFYNDRAIQYLENLTRKYGENEQNYDFLLLSLARILGENEEFEHSLWYYYKLIELSRGELTDELAYEIALIERASGNYDKALYYLNHIVSMPMKSAFYDEAILMIAGIMVHTSSLARSKDLINDILIANRAYSDILNIEEDLLRDLRLAVWQYVVNGEKDRRHELDRLFRQFHMITSRDRDFENTSLSIEEQIYNQLVIEEYVSFLDLVTNIDDVARQIESLPNTRQVSQIEDQISEIDFLRMDLLTSMYLVNLTKGVVRVGGNPLQPWQFHSRYIYKTEMNQMLLESYNLARELADKIVTYENILEDSETALNHNDVNRIHHLLSLLNQEGELLFGSVDLENEMISMIVEEASYLKELRSGLSAIKEPIGLYYHQRVAERLRNTNIDTLADIDYAFNFSIEMIDNSKEKLKQVNKKYDYALLDLLFQESIRRDQEYRANLEKIDQDVTEEGDK